MIICNVRVVLVIRQKILDGLSDSSTDKQNAHQIKTNLKSPNLGGRLVELFQLGHFTRYFKKDSDSNAHQDPCPYELQMILRLIVFFHIQAIRVHFVLSALGDRS